MTERAGKVSTSHAAPTLARQPNNSWKFEDRSSLALALQRVAGNQALGRLLGSDLSGEPARGGARDTATLPDSVQMAIRGNSGEALSPTVRANIESRLGFDLRAVRVHRDSTASQSADAIGARAYAAGRHVVFGPGEYAPTTPQGLRLLVHELAHVTQQASGRTARLSGLSGDEGSRRELDLQAERMSLTASDLPRNERSMSDRSPARPTALPRTAGPLVVQRQVGEERPRGATARAREGQELRARVDERDPGVIVFSRAITLGPSSAAARRYQGRSTGATEAGSPDSVRGGREKELGSRAKHAAWPCERLSRTDSELRYTVHWSA